MELKPCEDVGAVDSAVNHLNPLGHGEHAAKPRDRLLNAPRGSQGTVERDVLVS